MKVRSSKVNFLTNSDVVCLGEISWSLCLNCFFFFFEKKKISFLSKKTHFRHE
jgi:hypothetical protein